MFLWKTESLSCPLAVIITIPYFAVGHPPMDTIPALSAPLIQNQTQLCPLQTSPASCASISYNDSTFLKLCQTKKRKNLLSPHWHSNTSPLCSSLLYIPMFLSIPPPREPSSGLTPASLLLKLPASPTNSPLQHECCFSNAQPSLWSSFPQKSMASKHQEKHSNSSKCEFRNSIQWLYPVLPVTFPTTCPQERQSCPGYTRPSPPLLPLLSPLPCIPLPWTLVLQCAWLSSCDPFVTKSFTAHTVIPSPLSVSSPFSPSLDLVSAAFCHLWS